MTAQRLPIPGSDDGTWGSILNAFLGVSLNSDGTLSTAALSQAGGLTTATKLAGLADTSAASGASNGQVLSYNSGSNTWVPATVSSTPVNNATYTTPGIVQLAGDLGNGTSGTATSPQVTSTHLSSALPVNQGGTGATTQNFVDLSNNQTIAGTKTFSNTITGNISGNAATVTTNANLTGDVTSTGNATTLTSSTNVESIISSNTTVTSKAPLASPTFTGKVTTPALQVTTGSGTANQVLTSDASGNATWVTPASGAAPLIPTAVKTTTQSPYSAAAGDYVPVDTTSGNVIINLPAAPADMTRIGIKMVIQGGTNTVTINRSGSTDVFNKAGGSTSETITLLNQGVLLQYAASSGIWYIQADDLALTQLDSRYYQVQSGIVYVYGLVNDGGATDQTSTITAAAALLPASGGTLIFPEGTFGCHDWVPPANTVLMGQGNSSSPGAGSGNVSSGGTILVAPTGLSPNYIASFSNPGTSAWKITFAGQQSGQAQQAIYALQLDAPDTKLISCSAENGILSSFNMTINCKRTQLEDFRSNQTVASSVVKTFTSLQLNSSTTINVNGTSDVFTAPSGTPGTNGYNPGDVGRGLGFLAGLPLGSRITAVSSTTQATISQAATATSSGNTVTVLQGYTAIIDGSDLQATECRFTGSTTVYRNATAQLVSCHHTKPSGTGAGQVANTIFEAKSVQMTSCHFDSMDGVNSTIIVHGKNAGQSELTGTISFQNSASTIASFYTENAGAGSYSATFNGLTILAPNSNAYGSLFNLTAANTKLEVWNAFIDATALSTTAGLPNIFASGSNQTTGRIRFMFGNTAYTVSPGTASTGGVTLGTAIQNNSSFEAMLMVCVSIATATSGANIKVGVGPTATPTQQVAVALPTITSTTLFTIPVLVSANYYALVSVTGTTSGASVVSSQWSYMG